MLGTKIQDAFNEQMNAEFHSSFLYLSMSAYLQALNLKGIAHWMRLHAQEEHAHAMKFFDFINHRGGEVRLVEVAAPSAKWDSPLAALEAASRHECKITTDINELVDLAAAQKDHASHAFLHWFVTEQVEEEAAVQEIRDKLKLGGDSGAGLLLIDHGLAQRTPHATGEA